MKYAAAALVPTKNASRYLQQLCKHWSHNLAVVFTPERGSITFPKDLRGNSFPADATVTLQARDTAPDVLLNASAPEQLAGIKGARARHLDRFAFRDGPLIFDWR